MALECLDKLVGLAPGDLPCFTDEKPDDSADSTSGYFLTDVDFGVFGIESCEMEGWALLTKARAAAALQFQSDLRASLAERFTPSLSPYAGLVGRLKTSGYASVSGPFIGHSIKPYWFKGAKFVVTRIYLGLDTTGDFDFTLRSSDPIFTPPADLVLSAVAGSFVPNNLTTPLVLPFWSKYADDLEYWAMIERGSAKPLNNNFVCCGQTVGYGDYFAARGVEASTANGAGLTYVSQAQGMVLEGYLSCDEMGWLCELPELNGFWPLDVAARSIQFRGAAIAIGELVDTQDISPCTQQILQPLQARRNFLNQRYADNMAWLKQNFPVGVTDCFACREEAAFTIAKIRS